MNNILSVIGYTVCFLMVSCFISAQRERNYIYLFDCTQSMQGYNGTTDIWQPTKQYLRKQIEDLTPEMNVHIVPFQDKTYEAISFQRKDFAWAPMEEVFEQYIRKITGTNICSAWRKGLSFIDEYKDNYFIILTDGEDNVEGMESLCKLISEWCNYKHSYAFYVMLSKEAKKPELKNAVANCDRIFFIDREEMIKPFGLFPNDTIHIDFEDLEKTVILPFSTLGDFSLQAADSDPYFKLCIQEGAIKKGYGTFQVAPQPGISDWPEKLKGKEDYIFDIPISSTDCSLLNQFLHVHVHHKEERTAVVETMIPSPITIEYSWPLGDNKTDSLIKIDYQLDIRFSDGARKAASEITWKMNFENNSLPPIPAGVFTLLYNGKPCPDLTFVTQANEPQHILTLIIVPQLWIDNLGIFERDDKIINGSLEILHQTKLDQIKGEQDKLTFRMEFDIKLSLFISIGFCLTLSFVLSAGVISIIRKNLYPRFDLDIIHITYPPSDQKGESYPIKKYNRIVLTDKEKIKKPWFLQTTVITHPLWDREVILTYDKENDMICSEGITSYNVSDTRFKEGEQYTITNSRNGKSAIIKFY